MYVCPRNFSHQEPRHKIMKKICLILTILLPLCAGAQSVSLSFSGRDAYNNWVQLDHVVVTNQTKGWEETIYWPDTTMVMQNGTGIYDVETMCTSSLQLSQNTPNPFNGTTNVLLALADAGAVTLEIADVNGRIVEMQKFASLPIGNHKFCITLSVAGTYLMTARQNGKTSTIKMTNNGAGSGIGIAYSGSSLWNCSLKSSRNGGYDEGDILRIVGFRQSGDSFQTSDTVEISTLPDNTVFLTFDICEEVSSVDSPHVVTGEVVSITRTSAVCSGEVTTEGFYPVTERGLCWDTHPEPTLESEYRPLGAGAGAFSDTLSELTPETNYYYRAYATNICGTVYGETVPFTTGQYEVPTVTTFPVSTITDSSAIVTGAVIDDGGLPVLERGICWGLITPDSCTISPSVVDTFGCSPEGLTFATRYYARAYATNERGTGYGATISFTTAAILPEVSLDTITDIGSSYATCHGTLLSNGGDPATLVGLCWASSPNPVNTDNHVEWSGTLGTFSQILGGIHDAECYVRPYATNSAGTAYGNTLVFSPDTIPTSVQVSLVHRDHDFAILQVTIVCDSTAVITHRGLCMDTLPQPDLSDLDFSTTESANTFDIHVGNLERASAYYLRGHCISNGTLLYSDDFLLLTVAEDGQPCIGTPTLTDYDGHVYNTVQVGAQCWMKSNLYTTHYADGTSVPFGHAGAGTYSMYDPYYYNLTYDINLLPTYGYAYNWKALTKSSTTTDVNVQGICPDGWHVPSDAEWEVLLDYTGTYYACGEENLNVAKALSDVSGWSSSTANCSPGAYPANNNVTGFSAFPSGAHYENTYQVGQTAYIWSRSNNYTFDTSPYYSYGHVYKFSYDSPTRTKVIQSYNRAYPVRCLRDE